MHFSHLTQQIEISKQKDITPTNFQLPTRYPCIICYERCIEPLGCIQCKQIICQKHVDRIKNKCPNCRLTPFKYQKDHFFKRLAENQLAKERDILISKATFTCLVQGCSFQGKFHKMDIHRRKQHRNQELKDILFLDEREKKRRKQILENLLLKILKLKQEKAQLKKKAKQLFDTSPKKVSVNVIEKMLWHLSVCTHAQCQQVNVGNEMCFIGDRDKNISQCLKARTYLLFFEN